MAAIVGTKEAKEISICRQGANQFSHVLLTKSLKPAPATKAQTAEPENEDMDFAALKAVAAMNDVTKAYFVGLDEEAGKAFLAKSAEERDAEAQKAKDDADAVKAEDERKKKLADDANTDVTKALTQANETISTLQKRLDERDADDEIRKTASGADFRGYPGGEETVFSMLKGMRSLDAATRDGLIAGMKATAKSALLTGTELGVRDEAEFAKSAPATAEWNGLVKAYVTEKNVSESAATKALSENPAHKPLYGRVLAEQGAI